MLLAGLGQISKAAQLCSWPVAAEGLHKGEAALSSSHLFRAQASSGCAERTSREALGCSVGWKQAAKFSRSDVSLQTPLGKVLTERHLGQDPRAAAELGTGWGWLQVLMVWFGL